MWLSLFWIVLTMVISYAMQAASMPKPENATAGKLDVPEPDPGRPLPVVFGTNIIKGANVTWYGDAAAVPIKSSGGKK